MQTVPEHYPSGRVGRVLDAAVSGIAALPDVRCIILYGSYAKGTQTEASDVDLAVFFDTERTMLLPEYRVLTRLCRSAEVDIQAQAFAAVELAEPCGIVGEIVHYGMLLHGSMPE